MRLRLLEEHVCCLQVHEAHTPPSDLSRTDIEKISEEKMRSC